jgi:DNA repair ATPase RecN
MSKGLTTEGRTDSRLEEVNADARISELVRMLGTSRAAAEAHARGLLNVEE